MMGGVVSFRFFPINRMASRRSFVDESSARAFSSSAVGTGDTPGRSPSSLTLPMVSEMALHILLSVSSVPETVCKMENPKADIVEHW